MAARARVDRVAADLLQIGDARADYNMAKRNGAQKRSPRGIPSQGAGADYHYRNESDYLWMSELSWDIYRNNMVAQSITERAIDNHLQGGFAYHPQTGDPKLDAALIDWWWQTSQDAKECDPGWENNFEDQTEIVLRSTFVAGDIFGLPKLDVDDDRRGQVALNESHTCRSVTTNIKDKSKVFLGVEYENDATRRRKNYWFLTQPIDPNKPVRKNDVAPVAAYDEDGDRNVFHVRFPRRANQTRGITAYAPIFDVAGYHDDTQFLKLVQARGNSLWLVLRERLPTFDPAYLQAEQQAGVDVTSSKAEIYERNARQYKEIAPGSELQGLPGESLKPWTANIPNPEFFPHVRLLLTFIGINLGMPLVMALMDASETNFSGYRGAIDQARLSFRRNQKRLINRWHCPYIRFKLIKYGEQDRAIQKLITQSHRPNPKVNIFAHEWEPPKWPYIQPVEDATADLIRDSNMQISPRRRARERGEEWTDIATETVEDRAMAVELAAAKAAELNKKFALDGDDKVRWRDLAPLPNPERVQLSVSAQESPKPQQPQPSGNKNAN